MEEMKINTTSEGISIRIPKKLSLYPKIFLPIWLVFGFFFLSKIISWTFKDNLDLVRIFTFIPVIVMLSVGVFVLYKLIWFIFGTEEIIVDKDSVNIVSRVFNYERQRKFDAYLIDGIMLNEDVFKDGNKMKRSDQEVNTFMGIGSIKFNYEDKQITMAAGLEKENAQKLIARLKSIVGS